MSSWVCLENWFLSLLSDIGFLNKMIWRILNFYANAGCLCKACWGHLPRLTSEVYIGDLKINKHRR